MPVPTSQTCRKIRLAAKMQVEGSTWAQIAPRIGRNGEESARRIVGEHPELWRAELEKARTQYLAEIEAEASLTQRELLRTKADTGAGMTEADARRIRQMAAHSLLNHCNRQRTQQIEMHANVNAFSAGEAVDWEAVRDEMRKLAEERMLGSPIMHALPMPTTEGGNGTPH